MRPGRNPFCPSSAHCRSDRCPLFEMGGHHRHGPNRSRQGPIRMSGSAPAVLGGSGSAMNCGAGATAFAFCEAAATRSCRRQAFTMFAFRPCGCATLATDAPGCSHSVSTCCLCASGCWHTFLRVECSIVSTTELSWARDWRDHRSLSRWDGKPLTLRLQLRRWKL